MKFVSKVANGKLSVNTWACFQEALGDEDVLSLSVTDILERAEAAARSEGPDITGQAINNSRGNWFEWYIALGAIEWMTRYPKSNTLLLLPNVSAYDCSHLYVKSISGYVSDLRSKTKVASNVELISSNPDFVLISPGLVRNLPTSSQVRASTSSDVLSGLYRQFDGKCNLDDILGYISVKTSLRPDRRLQLAHEGSLFKALYRHIQTRDWLVDAPGIKYYAVTQKAGPSDIRALNTVATHSITDVGSKPLAAVDKVFVVTNRDSLEQLFKATLSG